MKNSLKILAVGASLVPGLMLGSPSFASTFVTGMPANGTIPFIWNDQPITVSNCTGGGGNQCITQLLAPDNVSAYNPYQGGAILTNGVSVSIGLSASVHSGDCDPYSDCTGTWSIFVYNQGITNTCSDTTADAYESCLSGETGGDYQRINVLLSLPSTPAPTYHLLPATDPGTYLADVGSNSTGWTPSLLEIGVVYAGILIGGMICAILMKIAIESVRRSMHARSQRR